MRGMLGVCEAHTPLEVSPNPHPMPNPHSGVGTHDPEIPRLFKP